MKIIKGNFSEKSKVAGNKKQKSENQFSEPFEDMGALYSAMLIDLIKPYPVNPDSKDSFPGKHSLIL